MMRALVWTAPLESELHDLPEPEAGPGTVLVRVRATGVCGSDLHGYRGHSPVRTPPLILGHEAVVETADGSRYVVNPLVGCGECRLCRSGSPNLCPDRGLLGLDRPGTFAEYVIAPERNLLPLTATMTDSLGTLVEPLATPINALGGIALGPETVVAVIGAGTIGLLTAYAARSMGAGFIACCDLDAARLEFARAHADVVGVEGAAIAAAIGERTDGLGADLVIDAVGVQPTWAQALELVRPGGTVSIVGLGQAAGEVPIGDIVRGGITVRGVYAYTPADFDAALRLLSEAPPALDWLSTAPLEAGPETLAELARGGGPVKVVLTP